MTDFATEFDIRRKVAEKAVRAKQRTESLLCLLLYG